MRYWHGFKVRLHYVIPACAIQTFIDNHRRILATIISILYTCTIYMLR